MCTYGNVGKSFAAKRLRTYRPAKLIISHKNWLVMSFVFVSQLVRALRKKPLFSYYVNENYEYSKGI